MGFWYRFWKFLNQLDCLNVRLGKGDLPHCSLGILSPPRVILSLSKKGLERLELTEEDFIDAFEQILEHENLHAVCYKIGEEKAFLELNVVNRLYLPLGKLGWRFKNHFSGFTNENDFVVKGAQGWNIGSISYE